MSLTQGNEFMRTDDQKHRNILNNNILENKSNKLGKLLSSYVTFNKSVILEGLTNQTNENEQSIKEMTDYYNKQLMLLDSSSYVDDSSEVAETSNLIDRYNRLVKDNDTKISSLLNNKNVRKDGNEKQLDDLSGKVEKSSIFYKFGLTRLIFYVVLMVIVLFITFYYVNINFNGYFLISLILGSLLIFIITFLYN